MYEIDFLAVGDGERSGDAIALRYTDPDDPDNLIVGIIDAGFEPSGHALVEHITTYYDTTSVDFVLSTHPDADHINGMGVVMRELNVANLLIHRPAQHGHSANSGSKPAEELVKLAENQSATIVEPFQGVGLFGGSLLIGGPTVTFYEAMLEAQAVTPRTAAPTPSPAKRLAETIMAEVRKVADIFPIELDFGDAGGTNSRNNSAAIASFIIDGKHMLFPSDAGVPAITLALDYLDVTGRTNEWPALFALPHHGSRHNLDRGTIERILGSHTSESRGSAIASVSAQAVNAPSPRVANAAARRGYPVTATTGQAICYNDDAPTRLGWMPVSPLPPLVENDHDD